MERKQKKIADVFRGREGHDLNRLARELRLENLLQTEGVEWTDDERWQRLTDDERPYSLRYGCESPDIFQVREELRLAKAISEAVLRGVGHVPLSGAQRKGKG
jgi:hypothetical protein